MNTPLFPAAQAVFWAFNSKFDWIEDGVPGPQFKAIAAALRAAADQVVPGDYTSFTGHIEWDQGMEARNDSIRDELLAIADELEAAND